MNKIILPILVLMLLFFSSERIYGCSCAESSQKKEFTRSKAVFIGKFVGQNENIVEMEITKSYKGLKAGEIVSLNYSDREGCDYDINFVKGNEYLIYAVQIKNEQLLLISVDCGRSRSIEDAKEDIKNMKKFAKAE